MRYFLVDYENIGEMDLYGGDYLAKDDTIIIFYSDYRPNIRKDLWDQLTSSGCNIKVYKVKTHHANALDFCLITEASTLLASGDNQVVIISGDKGFDASLEYLKEKKQKMWRAVSLEKALNIWSQETKPFETRLNLGNAISLYNQNRNLYEKISTGVKSLKIKANIDELIELKKTKSKCALYNAVRHLYGDAMGRKVYEVLTK